MPPEPFPSSRSLAPEDGVARVARPTGRDNDTIETVARTGDASRLVKLSGEPYCWALAHDDEDYRTLFGDASQVLALLPELGDIAAALVPETAVVADIPSFLQKQIDSGELAFQVNRSGNNLAHLVDRNGQIRHVLRLNTERLTPGLAEAWTNLRTRAVQLEIMRGLHDIEEDIAAVKAGLQDDRLALVDSAWSLIDQARAVSDSKYRKDLLDQALDKAVEGYNQLARSIDHDLADLAKWREYEGVQLLFDEVKSVISVQKSSTERNAERAEQVVCTVAAMESATRAAALAHMHHGEPDAARTVLGQFRDRLRECQFDDDDAVTALSSFARVDQKPLYARVLSSHTRALEVCKVEPEAILMPPPGDAGASPSIDQEDPTSASIPAPACSECGKGIEAGGTMCAYHRGKKREKKEAFWVFFGVMIGVAIKYGPRTLKFVSPVAKIIRL